MSKKKQPEWSYVAVYGTLRPGSYNYERFDTTEVKEVIPGCKVDGYKIHNLRGLHPVYPVALSDHWQAIVVDLLLVDKNSSYYQGIYRMEIGAGYEAVEVEVSTPFDEDPVPAIMFEYRHRAREVGVLIESGDWLQFCREGNPDGKAAKKTKKGKQRTS